MPNLSEKCKRCGDERQYHEDHGRMWGSKYLDRLVCPGVIDNPENHFLSAAAEAKVKESEIAALRKEKEVLDWRLLAARSEVDHYLLDLGVPHATREQVLDKVFGQGGDHGE